MESLGKRMGFQKLKENMIFLLFSEDEKSYWGKKKKKGSRQWGMINIQDLVACFDHAKPNHPPCLPELGLSLAGGTGAVCGTALNPNHGTGHCPVPSWLSCGGHITPVLESHCHQPPHEGFPGWWWMECTQLLKTGGGGELWASFFKVWTSPRSTWSLIGLKTPKNEAFVTWHIWTRWKQQKLLV